MELVTNLPAPERDSSFTGRADAINDLGAAVGTKGTCVVLGPSGVGKTRLAVEFAQRNRDKYQLIWLLRCDQQSTLNASLASMAERLGISTGEGPTASLRNDVRRWLSAEEDWLLIFDNAQGPASVLDFLPRQRSGHLIVTATKGTWNESDWGKLLELGPMTREESVALLRRRAGRPGDDNADTLAKALGDLPLALEQAAALVAEQKISFASYLRYFEQLWAELLDTDHRSAAHPSAVAMAWELSFRQLRATHPQAASLLALCSYLSTDEVRLAMLRDRARFAPHPLAPVMGDAMKLAESAEILVRHSLAEFDERSLRLHMATASLARTRLSDDDQKVWARVALRIATDAFLYKPQDGQSRRDAAVVLPHVIAAATFADELGLDPAAVSKSFDDAGQYLYDCGQFARSRDAFVRAQLVAQTVYREGHPRLAGIADNVARASARCGDLETARQQFERAIQIDSAANGYNHPRVAALVNNYGRYHFVKGDYETARQQFEWAKGVIESHYGPEHQRVAAVINNIGYTHGTQGDLTKARENLEKAFDVAQRTYPEGHPDLARICGNLGRVAGLQGDFKLAKALLDKALVIDRAAQGYEHPDTALDYVYLGDLAMSQKDFATADRHYREAMNAAEAAYGMYHDVVIACLDKLAAARRAANDPDGATWAADHATSIRRAMAQRAAYEQSVTAIAV